jgi:Na+/melibiose symporter-like transporter
MDQLDTILQSWGVMVAYLPWVLGFVILLLVFITMSLSSISDSMKDIVKELKRIHGEGQQDNINKTG